MSAPAESEFIDSLCSQGAVVRRGKSGAVLSVDCRPIEADQFEVDWSNLAHFSKLRELFLDQCLFADSDIQHVYKLDRLQQLSLRGTSVTEAGIAKLAVLPKLILLQISTGQVSEQFLAEFRKRMIATRIVVQ